MQEEHIITDDDFTVSTCPTARQIAPTCRALKAGFRLIDAAHIYGNDAAATKKPANPGSGRQALPEQIMNEVLFG